MSDKTEKDNQTLIGFWDKAFTLSEEQQTEARKQAAEDWQELAPSEKLFKVACSLGQKKKVLDYGCGDPNNIGRCGHICNASFAVARASRGLHIGEQLVMDCLAKGKKLGFRILQFNAVVESNVHARHLYERLGFIQLGVIPGGFRMKDGHYENICPYYHKL